jgi:hypothetical protein
LLQPLWRKLLTEALATKKKLELAFEKREPAMLGTGAAVTDLTMNALLDVLYAGHESNRNVHGEVEIREKKELGDIVWNE